jgi:hypothetical protein
MVVTLAIVLLIPLHGFSDEAFRFAVFSDSRDDEKDGNCAGGVSPVLPVIVQDVLFQNGSAPIRLLLFPGDLMAGTRARDAGSVVECNRQMLKRWMEIMKPLVDAGIVLRVTPGNHEVQIKNHQSCGAHSGLYQTDKALFDVLRETTPELTDVQPGPPSDFGFTYSFDMGGCHFTVLNAYTLTEHNSFSNETLEWLDADLGKAKETGIKHCFVASHPPAFPGGGHLWDSLPFYDPTYHCEGHQVGVGIDHRKMRNDFWNILKKHGVVAYFCGHEHNIQVQDTEGVWHVVSGAATPALYPLNGAPGDKVQNTELYGGQFQNPSASEIWPWNDTKKSYWGWCLISVEGDRVIMDVFGKDYDGNIPKDRSEFEPLKKFVLREAVAQH